MNNVYFYSIKVLTSDQKQHTYLMAKIDDLAEKYEKRLADLTNMYERRYAGLNDIYEKKFADLINLINMNEKRFTDQNEMYERRFVELESQLHRSVSDVKGAEKTEVCKYTNIFLHRIGVQRYSIPVAVFKKRIKLSRKLGYLFE